MKRFMFGLAALGLLSGCGIPGGLERPDPMWNREAAIRYECTRELRRNEVRDPRCGQTQDAQPQEPHPSTVPTPLPQQPQTSPAQ